MRNVRLKQSKDIDTQLVHMVEPSSVLSPILKVVGSAPAPTLTLSMPLSRILEGTYDLEVETFFSARHYVVMGDKAGEVHHHSYRVQAHCVGRTLDENQCLIGFADVKRIIVQVVEAFNGQLLNDLPLFQSCQPTTETLVAILYHLIQVEARKLPINLTSITLWETPTISITFMPNCQPGRP